MEVNSSNIPYNLEQSQLPGGFVNVNYLINPIDASMNRPGNLNQFDLNAYSMDLNMQNLEQIAIKPKYAMENFCLGIDENCRRACLSNSGNFKLNGSLYPPNLETGNMWTDNPALYQTSNPENTSYSRPLSAQNELMKDINLGFSPKSVYKYSTADVQKFSNDGNVKQKPIISMTNGKSDGAFSAFSTLPNHEKAEISPALLGQSSDAALGDITRVHNMVLPKKVDSYERKLKVITKCEHTNRKHYAKGMCSTCYHKAGRTKRAWNCEHKDELHYAKGCCQEWYLIFHSKRGKNKLKKILSERRKKQRQMEMENKAKEQTQMS